MPISMELEITCVYFMFDYSVSIEYKIMLCFFCFILVPL